MKLAFLICTIIFCTSAHSQFISENIIVQSVDQPMSAFSEDLDGDGDFDLLSASENDNRIIWYENLGVDGFNQITISNNALGATSVYAADLNGDGLLDVLSASNGDGKLAWYENLGGGIFGPENIVFTNPSICHVNSADIDGDGDMDIISHVFARVVWFENLGDGTFADYVYLSIGYFIVKSLFTDDLDGDGDIDIVAVGNTSPGKLVWYKNLGEGEFTPEITIWSTLVNVQGVHTGDVDGDGDSDIITASWTNDKVSYFENLGDGLFASEEIIFSSATYGAKSVFLGDLDGDGDLDLLFGSGVLSWFENLGGGIYGPRNIITTDALDCNSVFLKDIDNDGDLDPISSSRVDDKIAWYENYGGGSFGSQTLVSEGALGVKAVHFSDVDLDGDLDVFSAAKNDNQISWYENYGSGEFSSEKYIYTTEIEGNLVLSFNIDLDGYPDLIALTEVGDKIIWFKNMLDGTFEYQGVITDLVDNVTSLDYGDLDNDGDLDLLTCSSDEDELAWYENSGVGFGPKIIIVEFANNNGIKACDVDLDGDLDVVSSSYSGDKIVWYQNLGGGVFGSEEIITDDFNAPSYFDVVDIDLDGDSDILAVSYDDDKVVFFENLDGTSFSGENIISLEDNQPKFVTGVDLDLDGDIDILVANPNFNALGWYENLGVTYAPRQPMAIVEFTSYVSARPFLVDLDNDSDIDLLTSCSGSGKVFWFENGAVNPHQARGKIYFDNNENGTLDPTEIGLPFAHVTSDPENTFAYSYGDGRYFMNFDTELEDIYTIFPEGIDFWTITSDSIEYHLNVDEFFDFEDSLDFGLYPNSLFNQIEVELIGGFPRCNSIINYWLDIRNVGTVLSSGLINLELDEALTYVSSQLEPDSIIGQNIYWHYDSLFYFSHESFTVQLDIPEPFGDESVLSILTVSIDSLGEIVFMDSDTLVQVPVCSFDPNDKIANPIGIDEMGYIPSSTSSIEYTIRFQNTGTDTAINVVIKDQLDSNLDWSSIVPLASSHAVNFNYYPTGEIIFNFYDIMLPDSNVNALTSQGFIKYRINLNEDLPLGTSIYNTASILFDLNPAVITNTKINTLYDCYSVLSSLNNSEKICSGDTLLAFFEVAPSNVDFIWTYDGEMIGAGDTLIWITDEIGILEIDLSISTDFCSLDTSISVEFLSELPINFLDTLYSCEGDGILIFDTLIFEEGIYYNALTNIDGCDSVVAIQVEYVYAVEVLEEYFICPGDSILIYDNYQTDIGFYYDSLFTVYGCDSVLVAQLNLLPTFMTTNEEISICENDSVLIFDEYVSLSGLYSDTLETITGCDSIIFQELVVLDLLEVTFYDLESDMFCLGAGAITLVGFPDGGVFSGDGVTDNYFVPSIADVGEHTLYYLYEDDNGCTVTDSITATVVDCLNLPIQRLNEIKAYPNPFNNYVTIDFGETLFENHSIIINNILGQEVYSKINITGTNVEINKGQLGVGVYVLFLFNSNSELVFNTTLFVE